MPNIEKKVIAIYAERNAIIFLNSGHFQDRVKELQKETKVIKDADKIYRSLSKENKEIYNSLLKEFTEIYENKTDIIALEKKIEEKEDGSFLKDDENFFKNKSIVNHVKSIFFKHNEKLKSLSEDYVSFLNIEAELSAMKKNNITDDERYAELEKKREMLLKKFEDLDVFKEDIPSSDKEIESLHKKIKALKLKDDDGNVIDHTDLNAVFIYIADIERRQRYYEIAVEVGKYLEKERTPEKPKTLTDSEKELKNFIFSKDKTKSSKATGKSLFDELLKIHESILKNEKEAEEVSKIKELEENQKVLEEKLETRIENINIANEKKENSRTSLVYFLLKDFIEIETDIASLQEQDPKDTEKLDALQKERKKIIDTIKANEESYKNVEEKTLTNFVSSIIEDKAMNENLFKEIKNLKNQIAENKRKITETEERIMTTSQKTDGIEEIKERVKKLSKDITFDKKGKYYYKGKKIGKSATEVAQIFYERFDKEKISKRVASHRGVSQEEILSEWEQAGKSSANLGTATHSFAEKYVFDRTIKPTTGYEVAVKSYIDNSPRTLIPVGVEVMGVHTDFDIAGTIDLLLWDIEKQAFIIVDFKTNKNIDKIHKDQNLLKTLSHIPDTTLHRQQIQLSIYEMILEKASLPLANYKGINIISLKADGTYNIYTRLTSFKEELRKYFEENKDDFKTIPLESKDIKEDTKEDPFKCPI